MAGLILDTSTAVVEGELSSASSCCSLWELLCLCRSYRWHKSGSEASLLKTGLPPSVSSSRRTLTSHDNIVSGPPVADHTQGSTTELVQSSNINGTVDQHTSQPFLKVDGRRIGGYTNYNSCASDRMTAVAPSSQTVRSLPPDCTISSPSAFVVAVVPKGGQRCQLTVVENGTSVVASLCSLTSNGKWAAAGDGRRSVAVALGDSSSTVIEAADDKFDKFSCFRKQSFIDNDDSRIVDVADDKFTNDALRGAVHFSDDSNRTAATVADDDNNCNGLHRTENYDVPASLVDISIGNRIMDRPERLPTYSRVDPVPSSSSAGGIGDDGTGIGLQSNGSVKDNVLCNGSRSIQRTETATASNLPKNGTFYLEIVDNEELRLKELCLGVEKLLAENKTGGLPDEVEGKMRAAIGKASLLTNKKFNQFRGLCNKNLNQAADEPFATTVGDLAGFWDMVLLQVADVSSMFDELRDLEKANWKMSVKDVSSKSELETMGATSKQSGGSKARTSRRAVPPKVVNKAASSSTSSSSNDAVSRSRDQARQRLLAAKIAGRQRKVSESDKDIEIFIA